MTALSGAVQAQTSPASPAFTTPAERCIVPAATYQSVNPWILRAILRVESALKPDAIGKNSNGTSDIGIGQINSIHLKELATFGIEPQHLMDACIGTYVAAWHLKKGMMAKGNTWQAIASYHSSNPYLNHRYQVLLNNELVSAGVLTGQILPVPVAKTAAKMANGSTSAGQESGSMMVFDK